MPTLIDITGKVFGYLTVLDRHGFNASKHIIWRCKCVCGNEVSAQGSNLVGGKTKSCGCRKGEMQERRDTVKKGFWTGRIHDRRDT